MVFSPSVVEAGLVPIRELDGLILILRLDGLLLLLRPDGRRSEALTPIWTEGRGSPSDQDELREIKINVPFCLFEMFIENAVTTLQGCSGCD